MYYVGRYRFMSKEFFILYVIGGDVHSYIGNNKKRGGVIMNRLLDKHSTFDDIIDKIMETVLNMLFALIVFLGIPYFIYVWIQFLLW